MELIREGLGWLLLTGVATLTVGWIQPFVISHFRGKWYYNGLHLMSISLPMIPCVLIIIWWLKQASLIALALAM